jgi:hypothetical protein
MKSSYKQHRLTSALVLAGLLAACGDGASPTGAEAPEQTAQADNGNVPGLSQEQDTDTALSKVATGTYQIKSACNNNKVLDIDKASQENGAPVALWDAAAGKTHQQFKIESMEDGTAKITAVHSGKVLDVLKASEEDGAEVVQWEDRAGSNQRWQIEQAGSTANRYRFTAAHSNKVLDLDKKGVENGTKIQQWAWHGGCNQQWDLVKVGSSGPTPTPTPTPAPTPSASPKPTPSPSPTSAPPAAGYINTTYQTFAGAIVNPERGFLPNKIVSNDTSSVDFKSMRNGSSLVRGVFDMKELNGPLSQSSLNNLRTALSKVREAGLKVMLTFRYNDPPDDNIKQAKDAPVDVVIQHLDQLKPIFNEYADVIMGLRGGFVGAWGEWHSSSNGLASEPKRSQVWRKILDVLPPERMMSIRRVDHLREIPSQQVDLNMAFNKSDDSRTGLTNNCFLASEADAGTYKSESGAGYTIEQQKQYLEKSSKYVLVGGETCDSEALGSKTPREDCSTALAELKRFHFTYLNSEFDMSALNKWKSQGCYNEIAQKLGYRFELKSSKIASSTKAGQPFDASFVVKNVGYASVMNARAVTLVLRNQSTGEQVKLNVLKERSNSDPRFWFAESGEITVNTNAVLPSTMAAGKYDVLLSLHDPHPNLSNRPAYSIRMANQNVWEESTGLNLLAKGATITK